MDTIRFPSAVKVANVVFGNSSLKLLSSFHLFVSNQESLHSTDRVMFPVEFYWCNLILNQKTHGGNDKEKVKI